MNSDQEITKVHCLVCRGEGKVLALYERPGGPPGNALTSCPGCDGSGMVTPDTQARQRLRWPNKEKSNAPSGT